MIGGFCGGQQSIGGLGGRGGKQSIGGLGGRGGQQPMGGFQGGRQSMPESGGIVGMGLRGFLSGGEQKEFWTRWLKPLSEPLLWLPLQIEPPPPLSERLSPNEPPPPRDSLRPQSLRLWF
jgi:hypothetical protein